MQLIVVSQCIVPARLFSKIQFQNNTPLFGSARSAKILENIGIFSALKQGEGEGVLVEMG